MKRTMTKKYYVGSSSMVVGGVAHHFMRASINECINEAQRRLEKENVDEVYIVEVVRVVSRAKQPIIVEEIR